MPDVLEARQVRELVDKYRSDLLRLTTDLVRTPTENRAPLGDELKGQEVLKGFFAGCNVEIDEFEPTDVKDIETHKAWWPGRNYAGRPNLVVTLPGTGNGRSLAFNGHMDTVTFAPLPWETGDPLSGLIKDGRLYGRGGYDMKGGVAACAVVIKILAQNKIALPGTVLLQSVVDEENAGANGTLACLARGHVADFSIIPEPTNLEICPHTRGGQVFKVIAEGRGGVSYAGERMINPAVTVAKAISLLDKHAEAINQKRPASGLYRDAERIRNIVIAKVAAGDLTPGGNIGVPVSAFTEFFIQTTPDMTEKSLGTELEKALAPVLDHKEGRTATLERTSRYLEGTETSLDDPGLAETVKAFADIMGKPIAPTGASFGGDGFLFNNYYGIPTVHLGPKGGNAHGPDEWLDIESLVRLTEILLLVTLRWASQPKA